MSSYTLKFGSKGYKCSNLLYTNPLLDVSLFRLQKDALDSKEVSSKLVISVKKSGFNILKKYSVFNDPSLIARAKMFGMVRPESLNEKECLNNKLINSLLLNPGLKGGFKKLTILIGSCEENLSGQSGSAAFSSPDTVTGLYFSDNKFIPFEEMIKESEILNIFLENNVNIKY